MRGSCLSMLMFTVLLSACGEQDAVFHTVEATGVVTAVRQRFQLFDKLHRQSLEMKAVEGGFKPVDPPKEPAPRGAWRSTGAHHHIKAELPARAGGAMRLSNGPVTIEVQPVGVRDVPGSVADRSVVYRDAYPGADSIFLAEKQRVEEFILLRDSRAPKKFEYEIKVVRGGGKVRQLEGVVELLDAEGNAWMRLEEPYMVDGLGRKHEVKAKLNGRRLAVVIRESVKTYPILMDPGWTTTGSMAKSRWLHTATLLKTGNVLVAGGCQNININCKVILSSAELFDPIKEAWTTTSSMKEPRYGHSTTPLVSGKVLIIGGYHFTGSTAKRHYSAELYDPLKGGWTKTGNMGVTRALHAATLISSGKVLVAGGSSSKTAEVYSPNTGKWSSTGSTKFSYNNFARSSRLLSGKVLLIGGSSKTAEVYSPSKGTWSITGSMARSHYGSTVTVLKSGKVIVVSGTYNELYNPFTGKWIKIVSTLVKQAGHHTATLLKSGNMLVAGGQQNVILASSELYFPGKGNWSTAGNMLKARSLHTATLLNSGKVLVAGGYGNINCLSSVELYDPTGGLTCTNSLICTSGFCVDGICCESACNDICKKCIIQTTSSGTLGKCGNIPAGQPDLSATIPCTGTGLCDGKGNCKKTNGAACTNVADCGSGFCIDGVCCEKKCDKTCHTCNDPVKKGTCWPVKVNLPDPNASVPCTSPKACDGKGSCKFNLGQACYNNSDCASGHCKDDLCCDTACDKTCESCKLSGTEGTCTAIKATLDPDGECLGKDSKCGGACDGSRQCDFPGIGTDCGLCRACDGTGQCASTPPDDKNCGVIDCDKLDTKCKDFQDLTSGRCDSLGACKAANDVKACTKYTDLVCGDGNKADLGVVPDKGVGADQAGGGGQEEDAGCSCTASSTNNSSWPLLLLALMALMIHRRRTA